MMTRREFIGSAAATALLARLGWSQDEYAGFKMGNQTYTLRAFDLDETIKRVKELELKYTQFYPGSQMPMTDDAAKIDGYKKKLADAGLTILSYGVCGFGKKHDENKKAFEFAKAMGFDVITADPEPASFDSLESLTKDYGMKIAIHNHGPKSRYDKLADVQKAIDKRSEAIGACVDTGHYIRSGEDAGRVIRALGSRVHDVHLKDASGPNTYTILGEGRIDVVDTLKELKEIKFKGCLALEYELNEKAPMDDLKKCLAATRAAAKKL
jgi:sugar phosphate isomerase/epimerase